MTILDKIKEPVAAELAKYEEFLRASLTSEHRMTEAMLSYIFESRGKALRPLMALLTASVFRAGKELPEESLIAAMLVEMVHTASLVHDDVIDEAYIRRGKPSVKALWKSHRAVLIGDYIVAKSYSIAMHKGYNGVATYIIDSMSDLCEGELMQSDQSDRLEMTREIYDFIIYKKTASLMGASCAMGAMSVGASGEDVANMREFGNKLGMAFQVKDDILDYTSSEKTGKPVCGDIKERKINLPLLLVMEKAGEKERDRITGLISDVRTKPGNVDELYKTVVGNGGLEMAAAEMAKYTDGASGILENYPVSPYTDSLKRLCGYISEREM